MGSAAIVVTIILLYYFTSFDPAKDPFRKDHSDSNGHPSTPVRENPFDLMILNLTRGIARRFRREKGLVPPDSRVERQDLKREETCVKAWTSFSCPI